MTQKEEVLEYLNRHGSITSMQAFKHLGITRLAARISDLRKDRVPIGSKSIKVKARNGRVVNVSQYYIVKDVE